MLSVCRLFVALLKQHGPMEPNDAVIQRELERCSTEAQVVICEAGGVCKFLRQSLQFTVVDGFVCLTSDAGKARQLVRSRRQALYNQRPQVKLNPPPSVMSSASAVMPATTSLTPAATKTSASAHHSLAGMDLPYSSRVIPGLSQESVSELSNVPAFLSQPSASYGMIQPDIASTVIQTAVHGSNRYSDNGIKIVNGSNTWTTVSEVGSQVQNLGSSTSAIGELDDFSEPVMSANSSNVCKLTLKEVSLNDITTNEQLNPQAYYKHCENILGSDSSDSSAGGSSETSSIESEDDDDDDNDDDGCDEIPSSTVNSLDSFDTEMAETFTSAIQQDSALTMLSVTAPEFVPLTFAASQPSLNTNLSKSSPKITTSYDSQPSSMAAVMCNKQVQTDDSWNNELQLLTDSYQLQVAELQQQLTKATADLQVCLNLLYS